LKPILTGKVLTPGEVWMEAAERDVEAMRYAFDFQRGKQGVPWHRHGQLVALRQDLP